MNSPNSVELFWGLIKVNYGNSTSELKQDSLVKELVNSTFNFIDYLTTKYDFKHIYTLDTNVIFGDPSSIENLADFKSTEPNLVFISDVNRRELNGLKKSENIAQALDASMTLKGIQNYSRSDLTELIGDDKFGYGFKFKNNSHVIFLPYSKEVKDLYPLTREDFGGDDQIIACSLGLKNILNKKNAEKLKLITDDYDVQKSCDQFLLPNERYDELFETIKDTGFVKINIDETDLKEFADCVFEPGCSNLSVPSLEDVLNRRLYANEFIKFYNEEKSSKCFRVIGDQHVTNNLRYLKQFSNKFPKVGLNSKYIPSEEQECLIELLCDPTVDILRICGGAGSGKTVTPLAVALTMQEEIKNDNSSLMHINEIISLSPPFKQKYVAPVPGNKNEKLRGENSMVLDAAKFLYEGSIKKNSATALTEKVDRLIDSGKLSFETIQEIAGRSLHRKIIQFEESQNSEARDAKKYVSRIGSGSKGIFSGDLDQIENPRCSRKRNALVYIHNRLKGLPNYGSVILSKIHRSKAAQVADRYL